MTLSRREFLKLGGLSAAAASLASCSVVSREIAQNQLPEKLNLPAAQAGFTVEPVWRLLNRAGYGPRPGEHERASEMGLEAYLEEQLNPDAIGPRRRPADAEPERVSHGCWSIGNAGTA